MVAPDYARHRSSLAKKIGLGTRPRAETSRSAAAGRIAVCRAGIGQAATLIGYAGRVTGRPMLILGDWHRMTGPG